MMNRLNANLRVECASHLVQEHVHGVFVCELSKVINFVENLVAFEEGNSRDTLSTEGRLAVGVASVSPPLVARDNALDKGALASSSVNDALDVRLGNDAVGTPRLASFFVDGTSHDHDELVTRGNFLIKGSLESLYFVERLHYQIFIFVN